MTPRAATSSGTDGASAQSAEAEVKMVMDKMRYLYGQFIETVATGRASRGLTVAKVDELGRGQVWTGATFNEGYATTSEYYDRNSRLSQVVEPPGGTRRPRDVRVMVAAGSA